MYFVVGIVVTPAVSCITSSHRCDAPFLMQRSTPCFPISASALVSQSPEVFTSCLSNASPVHSYSCLSQCHPHYPLPIHNGIRILNQSSHFQFPLFTHSTLTLDLSLSYIIFSSRVPNAIFSKFLNLILLFPAQLCSQSRLFQEVSSTSLVSTSMFTIHKHCFHSFFSHHFLVSVDLFIPAFP